MTAPTELHFRKKPVEIEAFQMTKERRMDNSDWPEWLNRAWNEGRNAPGALQRVNMEAPLPDFLQIVTLEGLHLVSWGDWIIRGVKGELYPCKPDIFEATYEPAALPASGAEPKAWLVEWIQDDEHWVDAHADECRAVDQARRMGGICTPLVPLPAAPDRRAGE